MMISRKYFWAFPILLIVCFLVFNNCSVQASHNVYANLQSVPEGEAVSVKQVHRTGFHFQPKKNWMNDPNGPMYYNGVYHLFYQYNPKGAVWGNIVWAHSVSKDLINWKSLEHAIYASKPFDAFGCWSGSATVLPGNKPVILYTGIIDANQTQVQNYAVPADLSDPYLRKWVKPDNNPLISADFTMNKTAFRDPTTAWIGPDNKWRILMGSRRKNRGIAYLYRSEDFIKWTKAKHPLHTKAETGNWECPDFFPVLSKSLNGLDTSINGEGVKHVFKVSLDATRYEYYTIGTYDHEKDRYYPDESFVDGWNGLRYDYGNFYASKTFFDPSKNRRILWGWANESDSITGVKGWSGIQLIPRTLWLDSNGKQLLQWPIEELETLRGKKVHLSNQTLVKGQPMEIKGITAAQADVEVIFSFASLDKAEIFDPTWDKYDAQKICSQKDPSAGGLGPFGLLTLASENLEENTPVSFRVFKSLNKHVVLMCSDGRRGSMAKDMYAPSYAGFMEVDLTEKKLSLRSLIDHSVVESFGEGGKICISSRIYPMLAVNDHAHLYAFNNGDEMITIERLNAYSMKNPQINKN